MPYDSTMHQRRSIRLPGYDYASEGAYFITICAQIRDPWFGVVQDGALHLNDAGHMVTATWQDLPARFPQIALDTFIVMPDHVHGILFIINAVATPPAPMQPKGTRSGTVGRVVQAFKSLSTGTYIQGVQRHGWPPFAGRLWQRNYYEHVIRNEQEFHSTREYIVANPARWANR